MARLLLVIGQPFAMEFKMQTADQTRTALPLRDHTILGVRSNRRGFRVRPDVPLRVPASRFVLYSLKYAIAAYLLPRRVVLVSRLLFPQPKIVAAASKAGVPTTAAGREPRASPDRRLTWSAEGYDGINLVFTPFH